MNIYLQIAEYYNQARGLAAQQDIMNLEIQKIEVKDNVVFISLGRPGILIGRCGQNIVDLAKFLGTEIRIIEVESDQNRILYHVKNLQWNLEDTHDA